jgi:hypothetical protein
MKLLPPQKVLALCKMHLPGASASARSTALKGTQCGALLFGSLASLGRHGIVSHLEGRAVTVSQVIWKDVLCHIDLFQGDTR